MALDGFSALQFVLPTLVLLPEMKATILLNVFCPLFSNKQACPWDIFFCPIPSHSIAVHAHPIPSHSMRFPLKYKSIKVNKFMEI